MAYYVRKIARAKWALLDKTAEEKIENYRADTIANDMRTSGDKLSFWKTESLEPDSFEPVVVINSLMGDNIKTIHLICIPEEMLSSYDLVQVDGDTIVHEYKMLHHDLGTFTVKQLVDFSRDVILRILLLPETRPGENKYVKRFNEKQQLELIDQWLISGKIKFDELKEDQMKAVTNFRDKKARSNRGS